MAPRLTHQRGAVRGASQTIPGRPISLQRTRQAARRLSRTAENRHPQRARRTMMPHARSAPDALADPLDRPLIMRREIDCMAREIQEHRLVLEATAPVILVVPSRVTARMQALHGLIGHMLRSALERRLGLV